MKAKRPAIEVRAARPADRDAWREMWAGYCAFYETEVAPGVTDATWRRVLTPGSGVFALVAVRTDTAEPVGFAHYIVHPFTWSERPACYLEDLFVRPDVRGGGIGRALIAHLIALAQHEGWARLYWLTRGNNAVARRLYDGLGAADDFVRYVVAFDDPPPVAVVAQVDVR